MSVIDESSNEELEVLIRSGEAPSTPGVRRFSWLTVELPLFLTLFSSALTDGVTYNLLLYRTCLIDLEYNATQCALLNKLNKTGAAKDLETEVQGMTSFLVMTLSLFSSIMPATLAVFLGSWSDKYGRKALVVLPLFGQLITGVLTVVFSAISSLSPYWYVLCALPFATLGGSSAFMLGANLIVTDITNEDNRSFRLALLQGSGFAGALIGTVASSYVYEAVGYVPLYSLSASIYLFSLFYTVIFVYETVQTAERGGLLKIFNCELLKDMGRTCFKRRGLLTAGILTLLIASYSITILCIVGVGTVDYLFTRQKFQWLLKEYSIFSAVNTIIALLGMFLGMSFFQSVFKMTDGVLLILSYLSSISDAVVRSLSQKSWHMYLAGIMSMLGSLSPPLIRSQITKVLPEDEVSKMYSLVSCIEAIIPIFSPILFNTVYMITLDTFPGMVYVISGCLFTVCLILVTVAEILYFKVLKNREGDRTLLIDENEECGTDS